ncbi:MAG TPA: epimerase [Verrucomicrobiae bacterium]|nr:epimerase [Verrucomicrobiae bacterium]
MNVPRRRFIASSALALSSTALHSSVLMAAQETTAPRPLRILILGGTGFLGPACTESALARGHKVTHFNSGRTEQLRHQAGRPSVVPKNVDQLFGNRDPNKTADDRRTAGRPDVPHDPNSPRGLSQLAGRQWDAVIDTSGYFPRMVKASAELLAPHIKQYVFISTISVYADVSKPNYDETAPLATLADPTTEDMGKNYENFGGGKALCERAAETAMPGRVMIVRPGFIVGPRDTSGRFIYWPVRASLAGEMIAPGAPSDPIQVIDVRDLADWLVRCIERDTVGIYNATGPAGDTSMKRMLEQVFAGVGSTAVLTWVPYEFLKSKGVAGQFPLYEPPAGESAGLHRCNASRALAKGLTFRPMSDTAKVTLDWYRSLPANVQAGVAPQFAHHDGQEDWLKRETRLLSEWRT